MKYAIEVLQREQAMLAAQLADHQLLRRDMSRSRVMLSHIKHLKAAIKFLKNKQAPDPNE